MLSFNTPYQFASGNHIVVIHHIYKGSFRISKKDNQVNGCGGTSHYQDASKWKITLHGNNICKLQNIKTKKYLQFNPKDGGNSINCNGNGGVSCELKVHFISAPNAFKLESAKFPSKFICVTPEKWIKSDNSGFNAVIYFWYDHHTQAIELSEMNHYQPPKISKVASKTIAELGTLNVTEIGLPAGKFPVTTTCPSCRTVEYNY